MIGQERLKENLENLITNNKLSRFIILVGNEGSGKRLICKYISNKLLTNYYELPDIKVDSVRNMITDAYKVLTPTLYVIPNADSMSEAAKNSLLKITEEPPRNCYFVLTLSDLSNTLATIKSRGTVFYMDEYSPVELIAYASTKTSLSKEESNIIGSICTTPLEVDMLIHYNILDFYNYVGLVINNIAEVSGSNAFKIGSKIDFKQDTDKYSIKLFWKAFVQICLDKCVSEDRLKYLNGIVITLKYLKDLKITGINKESTFDLWILDIRKEWME